MSTSSTPTSSPGSTKTPTTPTHTGPKKIKIEEYTTPEAYFAATTAPLTSHIIIDAFEDAHKIHCPEMTFMQNSLSITHRKHNISLVFSTPEAILGTIHPTLEESTVPTPTTQNILTNNDKKNDPKLFIPRPVQVQASQQWQKHLELKKQQTPDQPPSEEVSSAVGDWTYSSLYQGQLYINHHHDMGHNNNSSCDNPKAHDAIDHFEGFFTPQFPFSPAKLHNTLTPDTDKTPQSPGFDGVKDGFDFNKFDGNTVVGGSDHQSSLSPPSPPPSPTAKIASKTTIPPLPSPTSSDTASTQSEPATSQFLQHLTKLVPNYDLLTQQHSPEQALMGIPAPDLAQFHLDEVKADLWHETDVGIDYKLLSNKNESIDFYSHLILFEDELHDNGTANYTIRIRVMKSCYYVLVRNFLRVDDVVVRIRDTRYFYPFLQHDKHLHLLSSPIHRTGDENKSFQHPTHDWLYRETKVQEATFEELRAMRKSTHSKDYTEELAWMTLPTLYFANHRIDLNTVRTPAQATIPE